MSWILFSSAMVTSLYGLWRKLHLCGLVLALLHVTMLHAFTPPDPRPAVSHTLLDDDAPSHPISKKVAATCIQLVTRVGASLSNILLRANAAYDCLLIGSKLPHRACATSLAYCNLQHAAVTAGQIPSGLVLKLPSPALMLPSFLLMQG